ncbi:hypothetical protein AMELA_G00190160 [Ameiurus melas]|uniref:Uncharacterized protein n=1 Tax=Ameiurus melas TaxID=219545 RepID=A0A7J6A8K8_AMEME|nr:hypothetical protein AMELA_G00190160 [Ameiurus melas]
MDQKGTNTGVVAEENNDINQEINVGPTENFMKEDITTVCSQQNVLCELSPQTSDLGLPTIEHPSPATKHPDFKVDDGNSMENVENRNAEIHTQSQTKKKKKFGSTRKPHGRQQPHAEGAEGEWKDPENTEEIEHQITTQTATSNLLTDPQNNISEVSLDIVDSQTTTEQKEIIKTEVEIENVGIDTPSVILSTEADQINTVVSDEVSNAEGLTDVIQQHKKPGVNEEKDAESTLLNEQEMAPIITTIQDDAFTEQVSLTVKKHANESPDNECDTEFNDHSTCGPVEVIPETQVMSDMQMNTENIHAVVSDQNQNIPEEHPQNLINREQKGTNTGVVAEENNDTNEEINVGPTEYFMKEDITTVCSQQNVLCELSPQTSDLGLATIEHPSPATEHPDFKENDGNSMENVENRNAEIHTQSQTKKKKKFGSTRKPHGRQQPHAEGAEGEWKDPENTEEIEHQITTQTATSNLLTDPQNNISEVSLDIVDSQTTTEQKEIIKTEVEIENVGIDTPSVILSTEADQINTVVSDEVSNAEGLTDVIQQHEKPRVNEEKDAESTLLNEQEMAPIITTIQDDAFTEQVSLTVKKHANESPDNECDTEFNAHSTCGPVELIPETQAMSDMQMNTEHIHAVVSDQNIYEEHLEKPNIRESEPEQCESTSPFVQTPESKLSPVDVIKENVEFSGSEKRRKMGSTRKSLRGQITVSDQKNKYEALKKKENIQEQNMDQKGTNTGVVAEENNDIIEEINVGPTENFMKEDITTVCSQQNVLCELSPQTSDLGLPTIEHPSPATEHPDFKVDDGNSMENVENRNAEIHTQTQTKKKKKFGSTRKPHGRQQPHAEGAEGEWKDPENTEQIEHQIITQAATSNLLTDPQNNISEVSLDIVDSQTTTEQKEIIKTEVEIENVGIDTPPAILSTEADQINTVVSDEVSNAEGLTDIIQQHKKPGVNEEKDEESTLLNEQEMASVITTLQDDPFTEQVSLTVKKHANESPDNECDTEFNDHSTCGPVEVIPETQAMSDMQMNTEHIHAVVSDQNISEEHLQNPTNRESGPEQCESTSPFVQTPESKLSPVDVIKENVEFSGSEKRRKMGSTRKSLRGQITGSDQKNKYEALKEKENIQEQNMDQKGTNTGVVAEENNDINEEINVGPTENFMKEDITTVCSQQNVLCELSPQTSDLGLPTIEHPSPATEHPDFKINDGNCMENVENRNAEIHTQTLTKKKKKFGSTRKPHGRQQPHAEGEWKDVEDTEEIQFIYQAASSDIQTELQTAVNELPLDILAPSLKTEQGMDPTHSSMELIPETQARLDMPVVSEQYHMMSEEHLENPKNRESKPEKCESTCPVVHIKELKLDPDDMAAQNSGHSGNSGRRKKIGSTRRSLRVMKEIENRHEQTTEESTSISEKDLKHLIETSQSIQTHSEPGAEKMSSICKNLEEGQSKSEELQKTKDLNPRFSGDIDCEYLKLVAEEDTVNPDSNFCDTETRVQEYEPQIHNKLDQSDGSLLSEIEFYLNKSFESTLHTTVLNSDISEFSEPMSEGSLQLPSSQDPQIHMEASSPSRRRKMGSSRKMSRNKHAEKLSSEDRRSEQENENFDKNDAKNSKPKREAKTVKETVVAEGTEDMKESVELMSEVEAPSQINESSTIVTGQPLPEGRRKFGSRRTTKGSSGLGAFTHGDYESSQNKTDVQVTKDDLWVSEPESTSISHPVSEPRPGTEEGRKTVVSDTNASTETGLVSLDNIRQTSPCVVSTGGKQEIDFEQCNEQIPDFGEAVYNVVMVGNSSVGKTSFIKRIQTGQFTQDYGATIGVDTFVETVRFGSRTVKLYVWDTAGQERYHSITKQVFHKAQGLLLMYDITSSQSFHAVRAWISQVQENANPDVILMLLGNKNDCANREVQPQEGEDLSKEYNVHFMECSAATGENVSKSLKTLAWLLVKQRVRKEEEYTTLQPKPQNKKSGCC